MKKLSPSLARLKKLNDEGLLEAYILLAVPDKGIAQDYSAYLDQNRDKLRRYVVEYVLTGGGNKTLTFRDQAPAVYAARRAGRWCVTG